MLTLTEKIAKTFLAGIALLLSVLLVNMLLAGSVDMSLWYGVAAAAHAIPIALIVFSLSR